MDMDEDWTNSGRIWMDQYGLWKRVHFMDLYLDMFYVNATDG